MPTVSKSSQAPKHQSFSSKAGAAPRTKGQSVKEKSQGKSLKGVHRVTAEKFSFSEANDRLFDFFRTHGFEDYPHEKRLQLVHFYQLLMKEQKNQNITRLLTLRDVAIRHFIDCLMVPRLASLQFPLLDIGTGAGFPGIPLKIEFPDRPIFLSEGVQKRVEFLKHVREDMKLSELKIIGRNINSTFVYPMRGVITRAVELMSPTLESVMNSLQLGGEVYFMKGPNIDGEIDDALNKWGHLYSLKSNITYELPQTPHQRRLVVFSKIAHPEALNLYRVLEEDDHGD